MKTKEWSERRMSCIELLDEAIEKLDRKNKDERQMIHDIEDVKNKIGETIIIFLKK